MLSKAYLMDRGLHWISALLLFYMLMVLSGQIHYVDWQIKGEVQHRQDALQAHATAGFVLVIIILSRVLYTLRFQTKLPRMTPQSRRHSLFINAVHGLLYVCIFLLAGTGILMVTNYELPLNILGIELPAKKDNYFSVFSQFHEVHLLLQQAMWWLIAIHLAGVLYAKR
ncbi:hypothetical protein PA25_32000 [Pseudoalteromonas sp. A25]|uniref:cytochrome b n=1 Tax=Pseudoalteromonas sp. A25 TaxID=116092 RepID=UPI001260D43C|nr:cytochrome b/b6 domain-containing protein [Pseudoalteromonas sp. A25]BBN83215.1 hypothetical protein PA25_32000 [Pseudoalteromonas sp. A25]